MRKSAKGDKKLDTIILENVKDAVCYFHNLSHKFMNDIRVLHLPTNVGGNGSMLARLEREHRLNSICLYEWEICNGKEIGADCVLKFKIGRLYIFRVILFYLLTARYFDVYHFNWGATLIRSTNKWYDQFDLPLLRLLNKRIVVTFQGTDCRQSDVALQKYQYTWYHDLTQAQLKESLMMDNVRRRRIAKFDRYADTLYCNTADLKDMLPGRTVYRFHTKLKLSEWKPVYSDYSKEMLTIVHAPTNRVGKGTKYIIAAIEQLKSEGFSVQFQLVEGMPHQEVQKIYEQCDIIIDQLFGWFGGLTLEGWALGKPVVCGIREDHLRHLPKDMAAEMPCINATPDSLYEVLKNMISDRARLNDIAHQSRAFAEKWYDCEKIIIPIIDNYRTILHRESITTK